MKHSTRFPKGVCSHSAFDATCSAKALSKYTEMVDSLIRAQMDALEAASDDARIKLREWELPECLQVCHLLTAL